MLKQIKRLFLFSALLFSCFTSCKKSSSNNDIALGTVSVSINGVATTFNVGAKAYTLTVTNGYGLKIQGYRAEVSSTSDNLTLSVSRPTSIIAGTYVENTGGNPLVRMDYYVNSFGLISTASAYGSTANPVTITITELTSTTIKGTFSGDIQFTTYGVVNKSLSNGVFYVAY